jgi:hypothetical protein
MNKLITLAICLGVAIMLHLSLFNYPKPYAKWHPNQGKWSEFEGNYDTFSIEVIRGTNREVEHYYK